jgi:PAS domain-containing protein
MAPVAGLDFRGIVDDAPDAIGVLDRELRYVFGNVGLAWLARLTQDGLVGADSQELLPVERRAAWRELVEEVFASGRARELSWMIETQDGPRRLTCQLTQLSAAYVCARWRDVSEESERKDMAARYLAAAGALLERFEPGSLQAIVDLAVPALADW